MTERRIKTKSSRTAAYNCFSRACAWREKNLRFQGPDHLAEIILPPIPRFMLEFVPLRRFLMRRMFPAGIYEYVCARTKVMDAAFVEALEAGFSQIVLLGAGFDTRALRFARQNHGTRIFELDAPTTQKAKLEILRQRKLAIPPDLVFAPIDFDSQDLFEVLVKAGFRDGQKTLYLWEGVSMYLTAQAVDATLRFVQRHSAPGSRIVFDYIFRSVLRREGNLYGEQDIYDTVSKAGEGWTFGLEQGEIGGFLSNRGFNLLANYTPAELEELYLTEADGSLHGRVNGTHCIAVAEIK